MLYVDQALETVFIAAGLDALGPGGGEISIRPGLTGAAVGPADSALLPTPDVALLVESHRVDPTFGIWTSESGAISMRSPLRPDEIEEATILLYDVSGTAELLARATIWPFYGIRATAWTTEADGSASITIVDGIDALEPPEAGFSEDLVRAWYILTEQPVVTHLFVVPAEATEDDIVSTRTLLAEASVAGYANRRDVRKAIQAESGIEGERLVDFTSRIHYELDPITRTAAYSLVARGAGGSRYPLIREIPWRATASPP
jgi:hypothetical protein